MKERNTPAVPIPGQLALLCESCNGERIVRSEDTPAEVCVDCDGTGIDPDAAFISVAVRGFWREARWQESAPPPRLDFSAAGGPGPSPQEPPAAE